MGAIAGILFLDGRPVQRAQVDRMLDAMSERGPDGRGVHVAESTGIGFLNLHVTPESRHDEQPLLSSSGAALVADVRIDNREELLAGTPREDTVTDSELLLRAYERRGLDCVQHVYGDFSFAVWDARRKLLFCGRDHVGFKPFYYYYVPGCLMAFASEIKALFAIDEVERVVDEEMIGSFLEGSAVYDTRRTIYKGIRKLPAASTLLLDKSGMRIRNYWEVDTSYELILKDDREYREAFRELFAEAVRCRMRSDFPVGSTLSGGLDSSSVACMASHIRRQAGDERPIYTYSAIFPSYSGEDLKRIDEREFMHAVADGGGTVPRYVRADQLSPIVGAEQITQWFDQPYFAPAFYLHWGMYTQARSDGVRVLLDGIDGDTAISHGWEILTEMAVLGQWARFKAESALVAERYGLNRERYVDHLALPHLRSLARSHKWFRFVREAEQLADAYGWSALDVIFRQGIRPLLPSFIVARHGTPAANGRTYNLFNPAFRARLTGQSSSARKEEKSAEAVTSREKHWHAVTGGIWQNVLELDDCVSARFQIEPRSPFFDRRLLEFCVSLPADQKLRDGWGRYILRASLEGILPEQLRWRATKSNVSPGFNRQFSAMEKERVERLLNDPGCIEPYMNVGELRDAAAKYFADPTKSITEASAIYTAVMLEVWLRGTVSC